MTNPVDTFPDAEAAVSIVLRAANTSVGQRVYSQLPGNITTWPAATVQRVGGIAPVRWRLDAAEVQIDVWGTTKSEARLAAAQLREAIHEAEASTITITSGNAYITGVEDVLGLSWLPDQSSNAKYDRYVFTVRVYLHAA